MRFQRCVSIGPSREGLRYSACCFFVIGPVLHDRTSVEHPYIVNDWFLQYRLLNWVVKQRWNRSAVRQPLRCVLLVIRCIFSLVVWRYERCCRIFSFLVRNCSLERWSCIFSFFFSFFVWAMLCYKAWAQPDWASLNEMGQIALAKIAAVITRKQRISIGYVLPAAKIVHCERLIWLAQ